ncbi:hypothetical protein KDA_60440 [Dictyobacter alpinus]|uniref:Nudix hydrolase domain-containing protein n=1 Tax=Dictyobacter alpinus TaxID=2014873 RepID=A0A402BH07_9CHLR|nr:NUDIX hydrolase [Dictyobacter alpinus]GCE30560.1 hypothetical protein KDA_60440 [Dictyobacter alpinus]
MNQNIYDNIRTRVIVLEQERILLLHGENTWSLPGGGLEPYESLLECAVREVREETGIEVEATSIAFLGEWVYPTHAPCPHKRMHYGYTLEVHIYAHPTTTAQTLQQEGPEFPVPVWIPLIEVASLPLRPKEIKTLAQELLAGKSLVGVPAIIQHIESPRATPPTELAYTKVDIAGITK